MRLKKKESKEVITYIYQIIQQNNVKFGHSQYWVNKKINLYILHKKHNIEFFNTTDFKNILYKIFLYIKTIYQVHNQKSFFLFASTNPTYNEILRAAAINAMMLVHNTRWTCGTISRRTNVYLLNKPQDQAINIQKQRIMSSLVFFLNYKKIKKDYITNSLIGIFIPDLENNAMIIKEALVENIPIIGIVTSNCNIEINYPIFGNSKSIFSVFFFSHLISYWIKINLKKYRGINKFYFINKKKEKNNILKRIKNKVTLFKSFKKAYMNKVYNFGRRFSKSHNTHISLFIFGVYTGEFELNNYKERWFTQKYQRDLNNNLFFPRKTFLNLQQRITLVNNLLLNNYSGNLSLSRRILGNFFWLNLRRLLVQKRKRIYKSGMSRNLLWAQSIYSGKKNYNHKIKGQNRKKWNKPIIIKKYNYRFASQNKKQWSKLVAVTKQHNYIPAKQNTKQWEGLTIRKRQTIKKK